MESSIIGVHSREVLLISPGICLFSACALLRIESTPKLLQQGH